jgi:GNAT superfamily N-acetyltransferase
MMSAIVYKDDKVLPQDPVVTLYRALKWSSADKPDQLLKALANSHTVVTAWDGDRLVGLGNAISDGILVVYYPHLLVQPEYQGQGIGTEIVRRMQARYEGFHQQAVLADGRAAEFYRKVGFTPAGSCQAMWIYEGHDHD